jgi:hypothetical protein
MNVIQSPNKLNKPFNATGLAMTLSIALHLCLYVGLEVAIAANPLTGSATREPSVFLKTPLPEALNISPEAEKQNYSSLNEGRHHDILAHVAKIKISWPPTSTAHEHVSQESLKAYLDQVRTGIARTWLQKVGEVQQNPGSATLRYQIEPSGVVRNVEVVRLHGNQLFGDTCVLAIKQAGPFGRPPLRQAEFDVLASPEFTLSFYLRNRGIIDDDASDLAL